MSIYTFALVMGVLYTAAGILGFLPAALSAPSASDPALSVPANYGYLFGIFPVNLLHNGVHGLIGMGGLLAWRGSLSPQAFARFIAVFYGTLAVMGLVPGLQTMAGLVPIFGHDVWLHAGSATLGAYYGWSYRFMRSHARAGRVTA